MWKRYFTIVLSILLVLACFSGCRSDSSDDLSVDLPSASLSSGRSSGTSGGVPSSSEEESSSDPDQPSENSSETGTAGDSSAVSGHTGESSENNSGVTASRDSGAVSHDASAGSAGNGGTSAGTPAAPSAGTPSSAGSGTGNASAAGSTGGSSSAAGTPAASPALPYSEATAATILTVSGAGVSRPYYFTLADLQSMTGAITEADYFSRGKDKPGESPEMTTHFKGIRVSYLIHDVMGVASSKKVKFLAADGYSATYSTSGIDSVYLNEMVPGASLHMLLAWEEDYQPCNLHLCMGQTIAGEYNRQHWVKDVISIEVK